MFFVKRPDGCGEISGRVVKLNKTVYDLNQRGRRWGMCLDDILIGKVDMEQSKADPYVFRFKRNSVVVKIVYVYADNITVAGVLEECHFVSVFWSRSKPREGNSRGT